ncbi:MAG: hypothetical protein OXF09_01615 [Hyphomicrobiales bacterium]|nr:hypothetical protein [Hyphomicrobiales bacterium]
MTKETNTTDENDIMKPISSQPNEKESKPVPKDWNNVTSEEADILFRRNPGKTLRQIREWQREQKGLR